MSQTPPNVDGKARAIVNTASVAAEDGQIARKAYSSSKGGIVGSRCLWRGTRGHRRAANCILPGLIDTPIYGTGPQSDEFRPGLGAGVLFPKRLGYPRVRVAYGVDAARQQLHERRVGAHRRGHSHAAQIGSGPTGAGHEREYPPAGAAPILARNAHATFPAGGLLTRP